MCSGNENAAEDIQLSKFFSNETVNDSCSKYNTILQKTTSYETLEKLYQELIMRYFLKLIDQVCKKYTSVNIET